MYILLQLFAQKSIKITSPHTTQNTIIPKKFTSVVREFIVGDETIKRLLEENSTLRRIDSNVQKSIHDLNYSIDENIERLFLPIYNRVDKYLDFHYSIVGEYSELGAAATGKISKSIEERLIGSDFSKNLQGLSNTLNDKYIEELIKQQKFLDSYVTQGIDNSLNNPILSKLKQDIQKNMEMQQKKLLTILGIGTSYKVIVGVLSTKIAAKLSSKLVIKGAAKASSKLGAAGSGLVTGAVCGPGAIICSPLFAFAAWFGTDALLISGDEYLHRELFKKEIIQSINEQKNILKKQYKKIYVQELKQHSNDLIEKYKALPVKKRERRRIKELID